VYCILQDYLQISYIVLSCPPSHLPSEDRDDDQQISRRRDQKIRSCLDGHSVKKRLDFGLKSTRRSQGRPAPRSARPTTSRREEEEKIVFTDTKSLMQGPLDSNPFPMMVIKPPAGNFHEERRVEDQYISIYMYLYPHLYVCERRCGLDHHPEIR